jgi:hypothetical protein
MLGFVADVLRTARVRDTLGFAAALRTALVRVRALAAVVRVRPAVVLDRAAVVLARPVVFLERVLVVRVVRRVVEPFALVLDEVAFPVGALPRREAPCRWATR